MKKSEIAIILDGIILQLQSINSELKTIEEHIYLEKHENIRTANGEKLE